MKLKAHDEYYDHDSDYYDEDIEDAYESTLTSILEMEHDMDVEARFERKLQKLQDEDESTSVDVNLTPD